MSAEEFPPEGLPRLASAGCGEAHEASGWQGSEGIDAAREESSSWRLAHAIMQLAATEEALGLLWRLFRDWGPSQCKLQSFFQGGHGSILDHVQ